MGREAFGRRMWGLQEARTETSSPMETAVLKGLQTCKAGSHDLSLARSLCVSRQYTHTHRQTHTQTHTHKRTHTHKHTHPHTQAHTLTPTYPCVYPLPSLHTSLIIHVPRDSFHLIYYLGGDLSHSGLLFF